MIWWLASLDPEQCKKFNIAAKWALRQHGVVRARCEEFDPSDLEGTKEESMEDPESGEKIIRVEANPFAGIEKLMNALESTVGKSALDRKGELRAQFYQEIKRNPGERISAFCTRYRTLAAELKREGIHLHEEELGWMLKERLGLDPIRKQLLETALAGKEAYDVVETECLRLFRDLHTADPLHRSRQPEKPPLLQRYIQSHNGQTSSYRSSSTSASSTAPSSVRSFRTQGSQGSRPPFRRFGSNPNSGPPRQAYVAELPEEDDASPEADEEELVPDEEAGPATIEEVLQAEAEQLATELQELEEQGCDPNVLDELEAGMEQAAESLATMREARSKIQEVKKDRGYGKAAPFGQKPKPHGNQVPKQKANTRCFDCGEPGHWAGDAGCPKPGAGLGKPKGKGKGLPQQAKQVRVAETLNTEHLLPVAEEDPDALAAHEVMATSVELKAQLSLKEALKVDGTATLASDKRFVGALDSACNRTCAGSLWLSVYLRALEKAPKEIQQLIQTVEEDELFRFGNGGTQRSTVRYRLPMMVGSTLILVWVSIVPVASLGLLLGRDFLSGIGAVLSFGRRKLRADLVNGEMIDLGQLTAGHFCLTLQPKSWPRPDAQRWRKMGQDGVIELQLSSLDWWSKQLRFRFSHFDEFPMSVAPHEHLMTEHGIKAAMSAGAQAMQVAQTRVAPTTSSSPSSKAALRQSLRDLHAEPRDPRPDGRRIQPSNPPMATPHPALPRKGSMARPWLALVALSTAATAVRSITVPKHLPHATMGGTRSIHVETGASSYPSAASSTSDPLPGVLHSEPARTFTVQESPWPRIRLHGGQSPSRNAGSQKRKRHQTAVEEGSHEGSSSSSCRGDSKRRAGGSSPLTDRAKRRFAVFEVRSTQTGSFADDPRRHQDDQRGAQERLSAYSRRTAGKGSNQGQNIKQFDFTKLNGSSSDDQGSKRSWRLPESRLPDSIQGSRTRHFGLRSSATVGATRTTLPEHAERGVSTHDDTRSRRCAAHQSDSRCNDGPTSGRRTPWMVPRRDPADEQGLLRAGRRMEDGKWNPTSGSVKPELISNPWRIHQTVKPGQAQLISQAWQRHERDRKLVSLGFKEVNEIYQSEWDRDFDAFQHGVFVTSLVFDFGDTKHSVDGARSNDILTVNKASESVMPKTLVSEIYTTTERVMKSAKKKGHKVGSSLSLETGWNFCKKLDRQAARALVAKELPYFLALAFPCTFWSVLMNLNPPTNAEERYQEAITLLRFAIQLAMDQRERGLHFILENPQSSRAWTLDEMIQALEKLEAKTVDFHQCRFKLTDVNGNLHRKATRIATSSDFGIAELDGMKCLGNHTHAPIIGGASISQRAGQYPWALAQALVRGMERQFEHEFKQPHSTLAIEGENLEDEEAPAGPLQETDDSGSEPGGDVQFEEPQKVSQGVKQALRRLHENTGHRSPKRLARALAVAGAPPQVVHAARHLKCALCDEQKAPKARRPASLPSPKDAGDQVHLDIFELFDIEEKRFYVIHAIDATSRFQMAEVLENKSSEMVERFMATKWLPILGPPRVLVADQGKEFVSHAFESFCSKHSIYLHHTAIQAPWQNGICERGGAVLKGLTRSVIKAHSVLGKDEMEIALQEAVMSYNADVTDAGVSPCQAAFGRQPRMHGDCLGDFGRRLSEHSLIASSPSLARQVAMRETARLAMLRLHFSRGLRKAEVARSRSSTVTSLQGLEPGSIVYFFRQSKYNNKTAASRKKLSLRRWHGPALLVALENNNGYVSYRGQLSKCALEHLRPASSLEQVASSVWEDAIQEVIESACHDQQLARPQPKLTAPPQPRADDEISYEPSEPPGDQERDKELQEDPPDLPPVHPQEMVRALEGKAEQSQPAWSRMTSSRPGSLVSQSPFPEAVRQAYAQRMSRQTSLDVGAGGVKRPAEEVPPEAEASKKQAQEEAPEPVPTPVEPRPSTMAHDALIMSHEVMETMAFAAVHPLRQLQAQVALDHQHPAEAQVPDHGTWRGNWPLPSRTEFKRRQALRQLWPLGNEDATREVLAVLTARKERPWSTMNEDEKVEFRKAATKGWSVWIDNDAVEILPDDEAARIRAKLKAEGQSHRILTPRFVYVDKNDGLRTAQNQLPLQANARLVVPGFADVEAYGIRCDAPTASRTSQHLLLTFAASLGWSIWSADIKSAFMKGEEFGPNERVLYLANIRAKASDEPLLPFSATGLCRVKKGVFGLADSPRRWYKRLNKAVTKRGWRISSLDNALWFLWSANGAQLEGMMISHVDDLLLAGNSRAHETLTSLGAELGFGAISEGSFTYCGKHIEQLPDKSIKITMEEYHQNLQPIRIAPDRKKDPSSPLNPGERKQLRAILGSLQWLVAQIRVDCGFQLSSLQGETPCIGTLMRANLLLRQMKQRSNFALHFKPLNLKGAGILTVSDASLGNVTRNGSGEGEPLKKVYSQAAYLVMIADADLLAGRPGNFTILDARSHRLQRVCRSTFAAEILGIEEAMDTGQYCRGVLAEAFGHPLDRKPFDLSTDAVPMLTVTDAKDAYDKSCSDTPSYGSQKSLAFTIAWIRTMLNRCNTSLRWTSTENMIIDCGTKPMDQSQLHKVLAECRWCVTYSPAFVKQPSKGKSPKKPTELQAHLRSDLGVPFGSDDPLYGRVLQLAEKPGWHVLGDEVAAHVCKGAKSFRTPEPRFSRDDYPHRTTFGRFENVLGLFWRKLEGSENLHMCGNTRKPLPAAADVLVTLFHGGASVQLQQKEENQL